MSGAASAQLVVAARLWAVHRFPYLAAAVFAADVIADPGGGGVLVERAWRIRIDPAVVAGWTPAQLGSVLVHHMGHLLRDHAVRAVTQEVDDEDRDAWLTAADAEINDDLGDAGLEPPLPWVTPEHLGQPPGRFAEEYFAALRRSPSEVPTGSAPCGSGADGRSLPGEQPGGLDRDAAQLLRCQVAAACLDGGLLPGTLPAGLRRWAETLLGSRVDWRVALRAEVRRGAASVAGMADFTYRRPSRRAAAVPDVVLPALHLPLPEVAVVCDTSGSINERQLGQALAEVEALTRVSGRRALRVVCCDAAVHGVQRVARGRAVELVGGGGTDMGQGIAAAAALRPRPDVVVVLTDGYTPWPASPPPRTRVIVALLRRPSMPTPVWARCVDCTVEL